VQRMQSRAAFGLTRAAMWFTWSRCLCSGQAQAYIVYLSNGMCKMWSSDQTQQPRGAPHAALFRLLASSNRTFIISTTGKREQGEAARLCGKHSAKVKHLRQA
jgi:hypothetical protein